MKKILFLFKLLLFLIVSKLIFNIFLVPYLYGDINNITYTNSKGILNIFIGRSQRDMKKKIYIIGKDGIVEELRFFGDNEEEIEMNVEPVEYLNMKNGYSIVFYNDKYKWQNKGYLISHKTGKIFDLDFIGTPKNINYYKRQLEKNKIKVDENDNIYYVKDNWTKGIVASAIIKINLIDSKNIIIEQLTKGNEYIESFAVDFEGNLVYRSHPNNDWEGAKVTFRKVEGTKIKLSSNISTYWLSYEGYFEYLNDGRVKKLNLNFDSF